LVQLACWTLLAFGGARAVVPPGFMLGPLADGWPVVLCPGPSHRALPAVDASGDDEGAPGHGEHDESCDPPCFLGLAFAFAAELDTIDATPRELPESDRLAATSTAFAVSRESDSPRPRGPPDSVSMPV
jgi:hypothetical protein